MPLLGAVVAENKAQWPMSYYDQGNTNRCPYDATENDGGFLWSHDLQGKVSKPVIGSDGSLYVTTSNDLIAISSDGDEKWKFSRSDHVVTPDDLNRPRSGKMGVYILLRARNMRITIIPTGVFMRSGLMEHYGGPNIWAHPS